MDFMCDLEPFSEIRLHILTCFVDIDSILSKKMASEVATVAPQAWKESSVNRIKVAQTLISHGDKHMYDSRQQDPLPVLRDACASDSNKLVHTYVRQTRIVVANLRQYLVDSNEEIKGLNRGKEALERALEQKRKDLALNEESAQLRTYRPPREKV